MYKKYSHGNEFISNSFSLCNYEINLNNTNNRLNYSFPLFPYSNPLLNINICFSNFIINNYRYNIYYSISYYQTSYLVYDYKDDYEEVIFSYDDEDYELYKSKTYVLYVYSNNEIYGFIYDTSNNNLDIKIYYYIKDELGIIHSIIDIDGNIIGKYEYNGYGLIKSIIQNNDIYDIMYMNPIRYKSYYYDIESNMYYLNSRYYHPLLCRFITPDSYEYIDINNIKTFNLYAYCNNDPINYADPEGTFGFLSALIVVGIVALGAVLAVTIIRNSIPETIEDDYVSPYTDEDLMISESNLSKVKTDQIRVQISDSAIRIYDSYKINDEKDMINILEIIMKNELYAKYNYYRTRESYIKEWKAHNFAYFLTKIKNAKDVDLNKNLEDDGWAWIYDFF